MSVVTTLALAILMPSAVALTHTVEISTNSRVNAGTTNSFRCRLFSPKTDWSKWIDLEYGSSFNFTAGSKKKFSVDLEDTTTEQYEKLYVESLKGRQLYYVSMVEMLLRLPINLFSSRHL